MTNGSQLSYADNVWNYTDDSFFLSNESITSDVGWVSAFNNSGNMQYPYVFGSGNFTYETPLDMAIIMNETVEPSVGVMLQFGVQILKNGTSAALPTDWFDNATIHDLQVQNASFYVSGSQVTPTGNYYDTELVFGGEGNGEATQFAQMNATLGLYRYSEPNQSLAFYRSYFSFGGDTAEAADNLNVAYQQSGLAYVTVGTPDYIYLGAGPSSLVSISSASTTLSGSSTSSGTSSSATASTSVAGSSTVTTATISSSASVSATTSAAGSSSAAISTTAVAGSGVAITLIMALLLGVNTRSRRRVEGARPSKGYVVLRGPLRSKRAADLLLRVRDARAESLRASALPLPPSVHATAERKIGRGCAVPLCEMARWSRG